MQACRDEDVVKHPLLAFECPQNAALGKVSGNGLQFVPALKATMGLHDSTKQICNYFSFLIPVSEGQRGRPRHRPRIPRGAGTGTRAPSPGSVDQCGIPVVEVSAEVLQTDQRRAAAGAWAGVAVRVVDAVGGHVNTFLSGSVAQLHVRAGPVTSAASHDHLPGASGGIRMLTAPCPAGWPPAKPMSPRSATRTTAADSPGAA